MADEIKKTDADASNPPPPSALLSVPDTHLEIDAGVDDTVVPPQTPPAPTPPVTQPPTPPPPLPPTPAKPSTPNVTILPPEEFVPRGPKHLPSPPPIPPQSPTPSIADTSTSAPTPQGPFREDISKILKDIKLPDRRDVPDQSGKPAGEVKKPATPAPIPAIPAMPPGVPEPVIISEKTIPAAKPAQVVAPPPPPPTAEVATEKEKEEPQSDSTIASSLVTPLRTLKEDLQRVIRTRKISLVRAVALEEEKKKDRPAATASQIAIKQQHSRRTFFVLFAAGVLFFLGAAALAGIYIIQRERTASVPTPNDSSLIFAETSVVLPLDNTSSGDIKRTLAQARGLSNATLGSITRIVPTVADSSQNGGQPRAATTGEFFNALGLHASSDLLRALGDEFFLGIHTVDKNAPVLVIQVLSYDHAFAGMLAWEQTMNQDMTPFFTSVPPLMTGSSGLPVYRPFQDVVMRNYDVRALKDDAGEVELYYSFPTPNILIIAESPYTFTEVLSRLQAERRL